MKKPLSSLDLNLLLCLQLLTQELSVTRTAKRMNVSPSAVSKSLAKLRAWFDDPLFVKTPLGLSPTPLMTSMEQDLADWMQMGNQILDKPHHTMPSGLKFELAAEMPLMMFICWNKPVNGRICKNVISLSDHSAIRIQLKILHWSCFIYDRVLFFRRGNHII